ncbi:MAG TPA: GntR family transcriptional regulator [Xanthobacteraceae bacterium]|nr:GntR family transcriptional regulator [Xanthobacteraceae bacterium]
MSRAEPAGPRIYDDLRRMAIDYALRPGERVNEVELAARLGVSRSPVREALSRLVTEGLMRFVPGKGFYCRDFDTDGLLALSEVRVALEAEAVRLATERAAERDLAALKGGWEAVEAQSLPVEALTGADEAFHARIAALSGNAELARLLEGINARIRFVRRIEIERPARRAATSAEHLAIAAALIARDGAQAERLMRAHIALSAADAVDAVKEGLARIHMRQRSA